jgi:hypothetical protein
MGLISRIGLMGLILSHGEVEVAVVAGGLTASSAVEVGAVKVSTVELTISVEVGVVACPESY